MKILSSICAFGLAFGLMTAGAGESNPATNAAPEKANAKSSEKSGATNEVAIIKTSEGEMVVEFWSDVAPKTVENFKTLAKKGFYDGTAFHRVIKGFMIQGGDPKTKDPKLEAEWGTGDPGYKINAEFNSRSHQRGVLSMARSRDPNSAGSQFFICNADASQLDRQYTAFGKVIKGDDTLEKISNVPVKPNPYDPRQEMSWPIKRVELISIKIVPADSVK